ncbi:hypothetical protein [Alistipes sp.]|uniref:hypothetical protein n=1 Tax=Alistipes sp. TaxID=1872444 RepID=UPI000E81557D|nr:hypothetical protein [Alistipes sp.]HBX90418.1 hypothetical protein [Alistipes sp.]
MGTIVWLIGVACAVWCVLDIFKKNISTAGKLIASAVVLLTSWVGLLVYMLYAKDHLTEWFR